MEYTQGSPRPRTLPLGAPRRTVVATVCLATGRVVRLVRLWRADAKDRRSCAAMLSMSDHTLRDIGLTPDAIFDHYAAARAARR